MTSRDAVLSRSISANGMDARSRPASLRLANIALLTVSLLVVGCGERGKTDGGKEGPKASAAIAPYIFVGAPTDEKDALVLKTSASGTVSQIEQAIAAGGNVDSADGIKRTPMFAAAFRNQPDIIRLLAGKGGNVNNKDALGLSPLHAAVAVGGVEAIKALLESGGDINIRDSAGRTPLHLAAATNQVPIVEVLLQSGAKTRIRDSRGLTPAGLATHNGYPAAATMIREWRERTNPPA